MAQFIGDRRAKRQNRPRAVALVTAMFIGLMCLFLSTSFLIQLPIDISATVMLENRTRASYVCDGAIQDTMAWIANELANDREPCTSSEPTPTLRGTLGDYGWTCLVEPDPGTPPHDLTHLRLYKLTAIAFQDDVEKYQIVSDIQAGQTFARFSMFIDQHGEPNFDFAVRKNSKIRGPIHKNRALRFFIHSEIYMERLETAPFDSVVSTTATNNIWSDNVLAEYTEPFDSTLDALFKNGRNDLEYGAAPRPLPTDSVLLSRVAWGGATPATLPTGVTVNPAGGVFVNGDVDAMKLSVNAGGNFELEIDQAGQITTIIEDVAIDSRIVTDPAGSTTAPTTNEDRLGVISDSIFVTKPSNLDPAVLMPGLVIALRFGLERRGVQGDPGRREVGKTDGESASPRRLPGAYPIHTPHRHQATLHRSHKLQVSSISHRSHHLLAGRGARKSISTHGALSCSPVVSARPIEASR